MRVNKAKSIDREKVDFTALLYKGDWYKMSCYDNDTDNIIWHINNCMNYIIMLSEEQLPSWQAPPDLELMTGDWSELELLALYQELLPKACVSGYIADAGVVNRVKKAFAPRRIYVRKK
tara:strand:+ start:4629 stop:4985 length:357 start_codon:yes stop_codon:yes gene_type:complete